MAAPKFTQSTQEALQGAQAEAIRREHQELQPEHLLKALVDGDEGSVVPNILSLSGVDLRALQSHIGTVLDRLPKVSGGTGQVYASPQFNRWTVLAEDEAKKLGDEYVSGEHFLLALF